MIDVTAVPRLVLDTNILVAAAYAPRSASRRIVERIAAAELLLVTSEAVLQEYRFVLARAVRRPEFLPTLEQVLQGSECCVQPVAGHWVEADPEDDKFIAVALAAHVDALVSNDHHVLEVGQIGSVRIVRPNHFLFAEETDGCSESL